MFKIFKFFEVELTPVTSEGKPGITKRELRKKLRIHVCPAAQ